MFRSKAWNIIQNQIVFIVILLLVASRPAHGVDISMRWVTNEPEEQEEYAEARCTSILPGECCKPPREVLSSLGDIGSGVTKFSNLLDDQFGAGWGANGHDHGDIPNCEGLPILRVFGPTGPWERVIYNPPLPPDSLDMPDGEPHEIVFAASWVDLRTRFPPDFASSRYLQYQGVGGLVLGKDRWSAASDGIPFPKRSRVAKPNSWAPHGTAYITVPQRWRYPDLYIVNGTNFTDSGDGIFKSLDGKVLN